MSRFLGAALPCVAVLAALALCVNARYANESLVVPPEVHGVIRCDACKFLIKLVQDVEEGKETLAVGMSVAKTFCELNGGGLGYTCTGSWQCKDVCGGAVDEFAPIVLEVAGQKYLNPEEVCTKIGACKTEAAPLRFPDWREPTLEQNKRYQPTGAPVMRIAHITDIHYDPLYTPGLDTDCGEPICCRPPDGPAPAGNGTRVAGRYGDYNCDTPITVMNLLMETLKELDPHMLVLTGDDPPHNVWRQSQEFNVNVSKSVSKMFAEALPGVPAYPALGNHNGFPVNQYRVDPSLDRAWLYSPLADTYKSLGWLDDEAIESFRNAGFYTSKVPGTNLRIVTLNTNFHSTENFWLWVDESDIAGMFAWFQSTMAAARTANEKVYVLAHHPPLTIYANYSTVFNNVIRQYSDIITGIFFGHDHRDYFQIFFSNETLAAEPVAVSYIPSAMNNQDTRNPSFRILEVDSASGEILDFQEYRLDLLRQKLINNATASGARFTLAYSAKAAYNMTSLSPSEWFRVATRMKNEDPFFKAYFYNYMSGIGDGSFAPSDRSDQVCTSLCTERACYDACKKQPLDRFAANW